MRNAFSKNSLVVIAHACALAACATKTVTRAPVAETAELRARLLTDWMATQERRSFSDMQANISPREPKTAGAKPPVKGVVVAALSKQNPDYYYHWVRDSSHVMATLAEAGELKRAYTDPKTITAQFKDFFALSRRLQHLKSPWSLGEPRYTVEAEIDPLRWSRPQYDGPALRALATLKYLESNATEPAVARLGRAVLETDLEFTAKNWPANGFDVWEEMRGANYQTRLSQLAALEKGAAFLERDHAPAAEVARLRAATGPLEAALDRHWDINKKYLRAQLGVVETDGFTKKQTDLDSAVIVAVIDADRDSPRHSVLDPRVQATVGVLEHVFREAYPINRHASGLVYGRYQNDVYFGGNPWFLITAYYARFYFQLAEKLELGAPFALGETNAAFLRQNLRAEIYDQLRGAPALGPAGTPLRVKLVDEFRARGDAILERLRESTPGDGQLYEQFDKVTAAPLSSRGIGWAHAAYLNAFFAREKLRAVEESGVSLPPP